ncbi:MAG TPA: helix-turn-helix domain-containing protein [Candidatus Methanofastidiosa archaeon]|nr:helix-turn-helix domain-containing protein [Candidatus Methanofastidiosa archaeon]
MKRYKALKKDQLIREIREGFDESEVYIGLRPCIDVVIELLENGPNLTTIYCPPSLYDLTSTRVRSALEKVNVRLRPFGGGAGRPNVYDENDIKEIRKLMDAGLSITRISQELDIPRRTIYHLLDKDTGPDQ